MSLLYIPRNPQFCYASISQRLLHPKFIFFSVPPQVSLINKPDVIPINEKLKLMCNINGFRPKAISVKWYRRTPQMASSEAPGEASFLLGPREDITDKARQPLETNGKFFSVPSCLTYTPTIRDDGAVFECSIEHSALKSAIWMSTTLSVTGKSPFLPLHPIPADLLFLLTRCQNLNSNFLQDFPKHTHTLSLSVSPFQLGRQVSTSLAGLRLPR